MALNVKMSKVKSQNRRYAYKKEAYLHRRASLLSKMKQLKYTMLRNRTEILSDLERAVAHAAGGGQGGDGCGQDSDNHLNGLALDGLPCLFLDFVEEIHDNKTIDFCFEDNLNNLDNFFKPCSL